MTIIVVHNMVVSCKPHLLLVHLQIHSHLVLSRQQNFKNVLSSSFAKLLFPFMNVEKCNRKFGKTNQFNCLNGRKLPVTNALFYMYMISRNTQRSIWFCIVDRRNV